MNIKIYLIILNLMISMFVSSLSAKEIKIDGDMNDWKGGTTCWTKKGHSLNSNPGDTLIKFWVTMSERAIFFRIDLAGENYDHSDVTPIIYIDSDNNKETGDCYGADFFVWYNPDGKCYAAKWVGKKGAPLSYGSKGAWSYTATSLPTATNSVSEDPNRWTSLEVAVPVSAVGIASLNQKICLRVITAYMQDYLPQLYLPPISYEADFGTKTEENQPSGKAKD